MERGRMPRPLWHRQYSPERKRGGVQHVFISWLALMKVVAAPSLSHSLPLSLPLSLSLYLTLSLSPSLWHYARSLIDSRLCNKTANRGQQRVEWEWMGPETIDNTQQPNAVCMYCYGSLCMCVCMCMYMYVCLCVCWYISLPSFQRQLLKS